MSVSAGPSISTRSAPMMRRLVRRHPLARENAVPRSITAANASSPVMAGPPSSPKLVRTAFTCSASSTRPMKDRPSSLASRRTRMFSAGSRSQTGSNRPEASQKRDSRWDGSPADFVLPEHAPLRLVGTTPVGGVELDPRHGLARRRADQPNALLYPAVVEHARRGRQDDRCPLRAGVDDQSRLAIATRLALADVQGGTCDKTNWLLMTCFMVDSFLPVRGGWPESCFMSCDNQ